MPMRLTEMAVEKLLPKEPGKRLEVVDAATPGLALRVSGPRNKTWTCCIALLRLEARASAVIMCVVSSSAWRLGSGR